jgi:hypothetical protein
MRFKMNRPLVSLTRHTQIVSGRPGRIPLQFASRRNITNNRPLSAMHDACSLALWYERPDYTAPDRSSGAVSVCQRLIGWNGISIIFQQVDGV